MVDFAASSCFWSSAFAVEAALVMLEDAVPIMVES